ncbi:hypothetical protein SAMN05216348_102114 [Olsenella sp. KH3B4]|uniref:hypothetical protein n=1 Tax=Olsenella sp. KH3B4 TaxID=1855394 RepID=UPI0008B762D7|nr:hypothetical protein [Olsenella sp. KH3B4]SES72995.1 hypothetical protein SAMN05216348_102114 [Olsenella sp. KH3B4]
MAGEQGKKHRMGQMAKTVLAVIGGITVVTVLLVAALVYELSYAVSTVDTSTSPDGRYTLELQSVGEPLFFSSANVRLLLKFGRYEVSRVDTSIADDGARARPSNWQVSWEDTGAEVRLRGSEQSDELVTMGFDGSVSRGRAVADESLGDLPNATTDETSAPQAPTGDDAMSSGLAQEEAEEIDTGYRAVYDAVLKPQGYGFQVTNNAKGDEQIILSKDSEKVVLLIYDRESANGACALFALESCPVEDYGSWSIDNASLLDEYAYVHETGQVIASGKTSWSDAGSQEYRDATGE